MRSLLVLVALCSVAHADTTVSDPCRAFGYSGKPQHAQSCSNGAGGQRTITCIAPFVVSGTTGSTIKLLGAAAFPGCVADTSDHCKRYGYSGKPENVKQCVNGADQRTITCVDGFVVTGTTQSSIVLVGGKLFAGCTPRQEAMCEKFGYSGKQDNVESCVNGDNLRTITCRRGYVVTGTGERMIRLVGDAAFPGCVAKPDPKAR